MIDLRDVAIDIGKELGKEVVREEAKKGLFRLLSFKRYKYEPLSLVLIYSFTSPVDIGDLDEYLNDKYRKLGFRNGRRNGLIIYHDFETEWDTLLYYPEDEIELEEEELETMQRNVVKLLLIIEFRDSLKEAYDVFTEILKDLKEKFEGVFLAQLYVKGKIFKKLRHVKPFYLGEQNLTVLTFDPVDYRSVSEVLKL